MQNIGKEIENLEIMMLERIRENFRHPDDEGYVFLTNIKIDDETPFEFARKFGFKLPTFKFITISDTHEAVWVREGYI